MRILSIFLALAFIAGGASAQVVKIPDKAKNHFSGKYPHAKDVKWTNNITNYTAEFKEDMIPVKATYGLDGNWNYSEAFIPDSQVPKAVKESIAKSMYKDWNVKSIVVKESAKGEKSFRVEVVNGIKKKFIFYDKDGVTLKENIGI